MRSGGTYVTKQARKKRMGTMSIAHPKRRLRVDPPPKLMEGNRNVGRNFGGCGVADSNMRVLEQLEVREGEGLGACGRFYVSCQMFGRAATSDLTTDNC